MAEAAPAPETSPLSVHDAVGLLNALAPADAVEPEEEAAPTESEPEPTGEEPLEAAEPIEGETEEQPEPDEPAIGAPHSWDAEARAVFATLPREAQQVIAARESERDAAVTKATQEAADVRKRAESEVQAISQLKAVTEQIVTRAAQTFKGKWDNVDWVAWAQSDPAAYVAGKAAFEAEQMELQRLTAVQQQQAQVEQQAFQAKKASEIKTLAPELVDPVKGPERVKALEEHLTGLGIDPSVFPTLDATVIALAYDGFKYRQAQQGIRAPAATPAPTRAAVRPAAAQAVRTPQRAAQEQVNRFAQTRSVDDAVAVLNSRTKANGRSL